jgi:hypothetical protein
VLTPRLGRFQPLSRVLQLGDRPPFDEAHPSTGCPQLSPSDTFTSQRSRARAARSAVGHGPNNCSLHPWQP